MCFLPLLLLPILKVQVVFNVRPSVGPIYLNENNFWLCASTTSSWARLLDNVTRLFELQFSGACFLFSPLLSGSSIFRYCTPLLLLQHQQFDTSAWLCIQIFSPSPPLSHPIEFTISSPGHLKVKKIEELNCKLTWTGSRFIDAIVTVVLAITPAIHGQTERSLTIFAWTTEFGNVARVQFGWWR